jgi:signal transduction histidine kinase
MKQFLAIIFLGAFFMCVAAQDLLNRDSLLSRLKEAKKDTNAVLLYINIGQQYESNDPEKAKQYYRMARDLSNQLNYTRGIIKYIVNYTFVLNMQGQYDSSLILNLRSVELSRKIKDSVYLAKTLFNTGTSYRNKGQYEQAVQYYEEGKLIFEKFGDIETEAIANDILQALYTDLKQYTRSIEYGKKSVAVLRSLKSYPSLGRALNNLGLNYAATGDFKMATAVFKEALSLAYEIDDKNLEQTVYLNLGDIYLQQGDYEQMKPFMEKALQLSRQQELPEGELIALKGLSFYDIFYKNYAAAMQHAKAALAISYQYNFKVQRAKLFTDLSNISYAMQNIKSGELYALQSEQLADSLLNETVQKNTLELEKKYEAEKKATRIKELEAEKKIQALSIRQKNNWNYMLVAAALTLLVISLLGYRSYRQKQKLQQQRISELETQQQLTATEAVLKGEEQERTRLAKDLHDGLGGMLSGIKYSFNTMKGNLIMTPENAQAFERSMDMLDSSIKEMRRVAHNMMPEALVKFGLDTALKDFCNDISKSGALLVSYQSIGLANSTIEQTVAITIYRIVQELINNTMKHAAAKTALVQVTKVDGHLSVTVEDDGKGFDTSMLNQSKGIGWSNIQNRVEFLKGTLDVQSENEKGTSVYIEVNI